MERGDGTAGRAAPPAGPSGQASRRALLEVGLPLEAIARQVAREAAVSPLHLWWSHKPGPACRAVLFAALLDDPGQGLPAAEAAARRAELGALAARLAAGEPAAVREARQRLAQAHPAGPPTVFDPFCGSGAIPCEAQRLGLPAWAADLNPVAVLSTAALLDFPVRFAGRGPVHPGDGHARPRAGRGGAARRGAEGGPTAGLAEDVRFYGRRVQEEAARRLAHLYPAAPTGEPVVAWIWCRTARCPNPACGAEMPLAHSFWLSMVPGKRAWLAPWVDPASGTVRWAIGPAEGVPEPPPGTVRGRRAWCLACGSPVPAEVLGRQGCEQGLGLRLLAMVAKAPRGKRYLPPDAGHEALALASTPAWAPETQLPSRALGMTVPRFGLRRHRDLHTPRQLLALGTFSDLVRAVGPAVEADARRAGLGPDPRPLGEGGCGAAAYAQAVVTYLALALDRAAARWCSLARWQRSRENVEHPFASPGLHMAWDFAEANPFSPAVGNWLDAVEAVAGALERAPGTPPAVGWRQADAADPRDAPERGLLVCTDPPYFANLPYADTSDLFYVWLRRTVGHLFPDLFRTVLTPKGAELVADPFRHGGRAAARARFLDGMGAALRQMRQRARPDLPLVLFYALRQTRPAEDHGEPPDGAGGRDGEAEGWVAMLESLLGAGFCITGTWPLRTEHPGRRRSLGSNALAASIVLVCRPRAEDAPEASLQEVLRELRRELPAAVDALTAAGVGAVDLAQAAIGPGMAVFSRYRRVLAADGRPVPVAAALRLVNAELDRVLAAGEEDLDAESRFCVAWFAQFGLGEGPYGEADILARAKGTGLRALVEAGLVEARAGKLRLRGPGEVPREAGGGAPSAWGALQQLAALLEGGGEAAAGDHLRRLPPGVAAAARRLAYRLYGAAGRRGMAREARAWAAVAASWEAMHRPAREAAGRRAGVAATGVAAREPGRPALRRRG